MNKGKVYLVGAGPGDEGLITVRGAELIASADVIVYDLLVNPVFLTRCKPSAELVYVGKQGGFHYRSQDEINEILVSYAQKGGLVVRLKGGDPYVFGRGGEEFQVLNKYDIECEVVPGITSGVAAPAYAGIPVTHRDCSSSITLVTGHKRKGEEISGLNWDALAKLDGTIAFYMGVKNIGEISKNLRKGGMPENTPVALVRYGTYPCQQKLVGTLANIEAKVKESGLRPPAITIVGKVVDLHSELDWFGRKPLIGKRILVTRARAQASSLVKELVECGAEVVELPTIQIAPVKDLSPLKKEIEKINKYKWILFGSVNAVNVFFDTLKEEGKDVRALYANKIAAIGTETSKVLSSKGLIVDFIPTKQTSEGFVKEFPELGDVKDLDIFIPGSDLTRNVLFNGLTALGAKVNCLSTYNNTKLEYSKEELENLIDGKFDWITFCSSSSVNNYTSILREHNLFNNFDSTKIAAIGEITAQSVMNNNLEVTVMPNKPSIKELVESIKKFEQNL